MILPILSSSSGRILLGWVKSAKRIEPWRNGATLRRGRSQKLSISCGETSACCRRQRPIRFFISTKLVRFSEILKSCARLTLCAAFAQQWRRWKRNAKNAVEKRTNCLCSSRAESRSRRTLSTSGKTWASSRSKKNSTRSRVFDSLKWK